MATTISSTDVIFATLHHRGTTLTSMRMQGLNSISEIICRLRNNISNISGLTTLSLRNGSQGWTSTHTLMF